MSSLRNRHPYLVLAALLIVGGIVVVLHYAHAAQFARPDSDVSIGSWTGDPVNTAGNRYQNIDEATASDSDFVRSESDPASSAAEFGLSDISDPQSDSGHVVRYRYQKNESGGGQPGTVNLTVELLQGAAVIASQTHNDIAKGFVAGSFPLTTGEAANITDYADLRLRFTADKSAGARTSWAEVSWAELETPTPPSTNLGAGTDPASATVAPGSGIRDAGAFTFQHDTGTDTVTNLQVTLADAGTPYNGVAEVRITSDDGATTYWGAVSNPSSNTLTFCASGCDGNGATNIDVTTSQVQYKIRVTSKTHANMPAVPGAEYALSPYVSDFTVSGLKAGSDSNANTLTIDNLSPNGATSTSGSAGDTQVTLNWTTSSSSDFSRSVVLRWAASTPGSEVPAEGTDYSVDGTIGTATVACVRTGDSASAAVSGVDGAGTGGCSATALTNFQDYSYKAFQKDGNGNYDAGVTFTGSPFTPTPPPEVWYARDGSGETCGPGTQRPLNQTAGASVATQAMDKSSGANTWNKTESRTVAAGNWSFFADVTTGSGGGPSNDVTVIVERRNSSCVVQETIGNVTLTMNKGTTEEYTFSFGNPGETVFASGDILTVTVEQTSGNQTTTLRFNNAAGTDADSRLQHPPSPSPPSQTITQSAYRWFGNDDSTDVGASLAAQDTAATLSSAGQEFRLRMLLHVGNVELAQSGENLKLQFADKGGGTCSSPSGSWADVTGITDVAYKDNATPVDGAALTANANDPTHGADTVNNQTYEELNNFTNSQSAVGVGEDGMWDFSLVDNGAPQNTAYCFRAVKDDGSTIGYNVYPEVTTFSLLASFDATYAVPRCDHSFSPCETGTAVSNSIVNSRNSLATPEPNQPNTIATGPACSDGTSGTYHSDESIDMVKVEEIGGNGIFEAGDTARITATAWCFGTTTDSVDFYYGGDADSPSFSLISSVPCPDTGQQTISSGDFTLTSSADNQVIRTQMRFCSGGCTLPASSCDSGSFNDRDDVMFGVEGGATFNQSAYRWFENQDGVSFYTVTNNPSGNTDRINSTAIDTSGGFMYAAGYDSSPGSLNSQWRIEKRNLSDGALVSGFGTGGVVTNNPSTGQDQIEAIAIDAAGGFLYAAGNDVSPGDDEWRIEKRNLSDGALVAGFGTGGVVTNNPSTGEDKINDVAIDSAGGFMYVVGYDDSPGSDYQWRIEKRNLSDGALVAGFGTGGVVTNNPSTAFESAASVELDVGVGVMYVGGSHKVGGDNFNAQWRIEKRNLSDGALVGFPWNVVAASFLQTFSVSAQDTIPRGVFFKPDGAKMYVVGSADDGVNEYDLSTPWNVSTAVFLQTFSVAAQDAIPADVFFKPDGTKMYVMGRTDDGVHEYDLSTPWNVSTAVFLQTFSVSAQETLPMGVFFKPDGAKMYVVGADGDEVNEYDLSTPWNVSTAVFLQTFSVSAQETSPTGVFFKPDGAKMYVIGTAGDDVHEYDLSTPWNVSTAVFLQTFSVSAQETDPTGVFFKPDGAKMYVVGAGGDEVNEYDVEVITSDPSTGQDFINDMAIDTAGGALYAVGYDNSSGNKDLRIEKYNLSDGSLAWAQSSDPSGNDEWEAVALDTAASVLYVAGHDNAGTEFQWRFEKRQMSDGALVSGFGTGGVATSDPSSNQDEVLALAIDVGGGALYGAGYDQSPGNPQWRIEQRSLSDGSQDASAPVGSPLAAQDTGAILSSAGQEFRLRELIHVSTVSLVTSGQNFKLQFADKGGGTCSSPGGSWADVTAATAVAYNDNPGLADGASFTANANDPTHGADTVNNQTYEELNNFTNSQSAVGAGEDGMWDFSLVDNGAPAGTTYCFRAVKDDGNPLTTYGVYPEITAFAAPSLHYRWRNDDGAEGGIWRKEIPVARMPGTGIDYQIPLTVYAGSGTDAPGEVYLNGKSADFPNDIRFTNGTGGQLSYWIQSQDATSAKFWVKMSDDLSPGSPTPMVEVAENSTAGYRVDSTFTVAQSFLATQACEAARIDITMWDENDDSTGGLTFEIQTTSAGDPSGTAISSQENVDFSEAVHKRTIAFEDPASLSSGNTYWIVAKNPSDANPNGYAWTTNNNSSYADGTAKNSDDGGGTWSDLALDLNFAVYCDTPLDFNIEYGDTAAVVAGSQSDAASTFIFFDDFEDGTIDPAKWTTSTTGAGAFVTESGGQVQLHTEASADTTADLVGVSALGPDVAIGFGANITSGQFADHKGLGFLAANVNFDPGQMAGDAVHWRGQDDDLYVDAKASGSFSEILFEQAYASGSRDWEIGWASSLADFYFDGTTIRGTLSTNIPQVGITPRFSLNTFTSAPSSPLNIWVEHVYVRKYAAGEPKVGTAGAEETVQSEATWKEAEDTPVTEQAKNANVRVRFSVANTDSSDTFLYALQYADKTGFATCGDVPNGNFADVPTASGQAAVMGSSTWFADGDQTKWQLSSPGASFTRIVGKMAELPANQASITLNQTQAAEAEYVFQFTDLASGGTAYCFRAADETAGNFSDPAEITVTNLSLEQSGYRFFENTTTTDVGAALAAQDTAPTLSSAGELFRLRALLHVSGATLALSGENFKLQFVGKGTGTCAAPTGGTPATYTDVSTTTVIAFNDLNAPEDGAALTANAADPQHGTDTTVNQTYEDLGGFTNSEAAILAGQDGMWDFALLDNGAPAATTYCLRMVKSSGAQLETYTVYPEVTTAGSGGGFSTSGELQSSTFDTAITPGSAPNTILFSGTEPSDSQVEFQFASSDCSNGASNPNVCDQDIGWDDADTPFVGPDGTSSTFYSADPDVEVEILTSDTRDYLNNKQYFRYKVILRASGDGTQTPTVTQIVVDWSP